MKQKVVSVSFQDGLHNAIENQVVNCDHSLVDFKFSMSNYDNWGSLSVDHKIDILSKQLAGYIRKKLPENIDISRSTARGRYVGNKGRILSGMVDYELRSNINGASSRISAMLICRH